MPRAGDSHSIPWTDERGPLLKDQIELIRSNKNDVRSHRPQFCIERLLSSIDARTAVIIEFEETFDLRWNADMRAIARWREAHPGKELIMPDHADLCVWLLNERDKLMDLKTETCAEEKTSPEAKEKS